MDQPPTKREKVPKTPEEKVNGFVAEFNLDTLLPTEFKDLKVEQKLKVIRDFKKRVVDVVKSDAQTQYSEGSKEKSIIKSAWGSLTKETGTVKNLEKEVFEKLKNTPEGQALIVEDLAILTRRVQGKNIIPTLEGGVGLDYLSEDPINTPENTKEVNNFNRKAEKFANMPYEWGQEKKGLGKVVMGKRIGNTHRKEYEKAKAEYEKAREEILEIKKGKEDPEKAVLEVMEIDNIVKMEQLLSTHPEFEKLLDGFANDAGNAEIIKNAGNVINNLTGRNWTNRLLIAGGFSARMAARGAAFATGATGITFLAAPTVGGVIGWYRGKFRGKETLQKRQKGARHGHEDKSKEKAKIVDAATLANGLQKMADQAESATNEEERGKIMSKLGVVIDYTKNQIEEGQVNFGDIKSALVNQFNLTNNLNRALAITASGENNKELTERIDILITKFEQGYERTAKDGTKKFVAGETQKISEAQKAFIRKQARNGAILGASLAVGGYGLRALGEHFGWWGGGVQEGRPSTGAKGQDINLPNERLESASTITGPGVEPLKDLPGEQQPMPSAVETPTEAGMIKTEPLKTMPMRINPDDFPKITAADLETSPEKAAAVTEIKFMEGKGGIKGILEFKEQMRNQYKDLSKLPQEMQDFLNDRSPERNLQMAKDFGFYNPDQDAESARIIEGSSLRFDAEKGKMIFRDHNGKETEKFMGEMFDSDGSVKTPTPETGTVKSVPDLEHDNPAEMSPSASNLPEEVAESAGQEQLVKTLRDYGFTGDPSDRKAVAEFFAKNPSIETPTHPDAPLESMPKPRPVPTAEELSAVIKEKIPGRVPGQDVTGRVGRPGPYYDTGYRERSPGFNYSVEAMEKSRFPGGSGSWWRQHGYNPAYGIPGGNLEAFPELLNHPEFANNPFHLSGEQLVEVYHTYEDNLRVMFPPDKAQVWGTIRHLKAKDLLKNQVPSDRFSSYLYQLRHLTNLKPKGGLFTKEETVEKYVIRALQRAEEMGALEGLKLFR